MEVIIQSNEETAARTVAEFIARAVKAKPTLVLGLATGCTMEPVYDELVRKRQEEGLDFSLCRSFNLDEYVGLPPDDPSSYHHFMRRRFFDRVNMDLRNTHLPDGMAADLEAECARYEQLIAASGGIDLQLLGIGLNGHLGFNEPPAAVQSRTRVEILSPVTRAQNAPLFPKSKPVPRRAVTMGVGTILEARRCLLLATGSEKAQVVARAIEGPMTPTITASVLQMHRACTVVLDEAAAGNLRDKERYRRGFPAPTALPAVAKSTAALDGNGRRRSKAKPRKPLLTVKS